MVATDIEIIGILPSLKTARKWFMQHPEPDLLFMDIQLGDGVSFELFDTYRLDCPVIFTTAYDEYAIRAFKVNGIDYLLKPVDEDELRTAIDKCRKNLGGPKAVDLLPDMRELIQSVFRGDQQRPLYKEKFIVTVRQQWIPVETKAIACFLRDNLNYLYTFGNDKYILDYTTLEDIEELLDPAMFYRANRQTIINMEAIQSVRQHENQKLTLRLKIASPAEVDISREKAPSFKKWFDR
jgi:DNA-binding LytR/AlgR family response regulator